MRLVPVLTDPVHVVPGFIQLEHVADIHRATDADFIRPIPLNSTLGHQAIR